jgi:hypothetical protein
VRGDPDQHVAEVKAVMVFLNSVPPAAAVGGSISTIGGGYLVQWFGFLAGFLSLVH